MQKLIVKKDDTLYNYLRENLNNKSKNNIKSLLKKNQIKVNNNITSKYDYNILAGDIITILDNYTNTSTNITLDIIYEDNDIIVVNKPPGILSISNSKEKELTLYREVSNYLKKQNKKVFVIHRLDKDTSGVIMFAKNQKIQKLYQDNWNKLAILREYTSVVYGTTPKEGHIESYLKQSKDLKVYSSKNKDGLFSITDYERLKHNDKYSLLKIHISTGRRNQIRCHMSDIGHPLVGDTRYNKKKDKSKRLYLHANKLEVINPLTKKVLTFTCPIPESFYELLK